MNVTKKSFVLTIVSFCILLLLNFTVAAPWNDLQIGELASQDRQSLQTLHPGIRHWTIDDPRGPWKLNVVEVDLRHPDVSIESARAKDQLHGREQLSSMVRRLQAPRRRVVAAINADFFDLRTGENLNNQIIAETYVKGVTGSRFSDASFRNGRSQFAFSSSRRPLIEQFDFSGKMFRNDGSEFPLTGVNISPRESSLVLRNAYVSETVLPESGLGLRLQVLMRPVRKSFDTLFFVVTNAWPPDRSSTPTSTDWLLQISGHNTFAAGIHSGDTLRAWLGTDPYVGPLRTLVGGWPRIVLNGTNLAAQSDTLEGAAARFSTQRHPRTGVGFSRDSTKVYMITVDGRQSTSVGMTLSEFADAMLSVGVWNGLNLDGGGSTTMIVDGIIMNSPSDPTGERPIANCLLVIVEELN